MLTGRRVIQLWPPRSMTKSLLKPKGTADLFPAYAVDIGLRIGRTDPEKKRELFEETIALNPVHAKAGLARLHMAIDYYAAGQLTEADALVDQILAYGHPKALFPGKRICIGRAIF